MGNIVGIVNGTKISSMRTGYYAVKAMELTFSREENKIHVFMFGTAPVAKAIILTLAYAHSDKVEHLAVHSIGESTFTLASEIRGQVPFKLCPVLPGDSLSLLKNAHYIITATNFSAPLFKKDVIASGIITLSLEIDNMPGDYINYVLHNKIVTCDKVETIEHCNAQALPLYFSRIG